jgi:hypothetical protein
MKLNRDKVYLCIHKKLQTMRLYFYRGDSWVYSGKEYIYNQNNFITSFCVDSNDNFSKDKPKEYYIEEYDKEVLETTIRMFNYLKESLLFPAGVDDAYKNTVVEDYMRYFASNPKALRDITAEGLLPCEAKRCTETVDTFQSFKEKYLRLGQGYY